MDKSQITAEQIKRGRTLLMTIAVIGFFKWTALTFAFLLLFIPSWNNNSFATPTAIALYITFGSILGVQVFLALGYKLISGSYALAIVTAMTFLPFVEMFFAMHDSAMLFMIPEGEKRREILANAKKEALKTNPVE